MFSIVCVSFFTTAKIIYFPENGKVL